MKVDVTKKIKQFYAEDEKEMKEKGAEALTFGRIMTTSLLQGGNDADPQKGGKLTADDKLSNYLLAIRIREAKKLVELNAAEAAKIRQYVGEIFPSVTIGQVFPVLDGK